MCTSTCVSAHAFVKTDKGGDAAKFRQVQEAYSTLSEPRKRAIYDVKYDLHRRRALAREREAEEAKLAEAKKKKKEKEKEKRERKVNVLAVHLLPLHYAG